MISRRQEKVNSLFRSLASSFLLKEVNGIFITIMRTETSKDLKNAKIFVSIFPESREKEMLDALKEKTDELRKYIGSQISMKFLPNFEFEIDAQEKAGKKIDELLNDSVVKQDKSA